MTPSFYTLFLQLNIYKYNFNLKVILISYICQDISIFSSLSYSLLFPFFFLSPSSSYLSLLSLSIFTLSLSPSLSLSVSLYLILFISFIFSSDDIKKSYFCTVYTSPSFYNLFSYKIRISLNTLLINI